ncbi:MAG: MotA/TolQ/ExbB proton channel family protein [Gammaproteobacteria bacterium]|nr:MotA/TolQ/ExbB proton channel family protein [Gammaproteobacteria bacterium]
MQVYEALTRFLIAGGFFMLPIAIVCMVGMMVALERVGFLAYTTVMGKRTWKRVLPLIDTGNFDAAANAASTARCAMGDMLCRGLRSLHHGRRQDDIERAMESSLDDILPRLERHTHYLVKFANVAILTGLLGTLVAFASVFATVTQSHPSEQAELMAAGVAASINPAAFGLIVAIPLLLIHTFLQTLTTDLMDHFEMVAAHFAERVAYVRRNSDDEVVPNKPLLRVVDGSKPAEERREPAVV